LGWAPLCANTDGPLPGSCGYVHVLDSSEMLNNAAEFVL
jgi:hypothetical protein